jgi:hypothetical protein
MTGAPTRLPAVNPLAKPIRIPTTSAAAAIVQILIAL